MKKFILALMAVMTINLSANAMSYSQAREQALFLTDKMAYELNLNERQYEAAYEINLDYLMGINHYDDLYGVYWTRRNLDLSYILLDWQYRSYCAASYFYRPLYWHGGCWHFGIYARYPHRDYFYFGRPHFVTVYRGGHSWHHNGNRSWYRGRDFGHHNHKGSNREFGMRDRFDRGDYGKGTREFGGRTHQPVRSSSVRNDKNVQSFGGRNNRTDNNEHRNGSFGNRAERKSTENGNRTGSFGNRVNQQPAGSSHQFGNRTNSGVRSSTRTTVERRNSESNPSFGNRTNHSPSRTFSPGSSVSPSRSGSGLFGNRSGGSSFGGGRSGGSSSGSSRSGGGSFGGGHR